jgi:hypothetical protein
MSDRFKSARFYSDECGGEFTAKFRETTGGNCGHRTPYEIRVVKNGKTVWAPKAPLCAASDKPKRIAEDVAGFFDHNRCGVGQLGGVRRRKKRRW